MSKKSSAKRKRDRAHKLLAAANQNNLTTPTSQQSSSKNGGGDGSSSAKSINSSNSVSSAPRLDDVSRDLARAVTAVAVATDNNESAETAFGSRKRALIKVDFVYPKKNGQAQPGQFHFGNNNKHDSAATSNGGSSTGENIQQTSPSVLVKTNVSIEEILNMNKRPRKAGSGEPFSIPTLGSLQTSRLSPPAAKKEKATGKTMQKNQQQHAQENGGSARTPEAHHDAGHLSGMSVEEAVRDKLGCRPRANSTDGELNLPQRGLCDERKVLLSHKWNLQTYDMTRAVPKGFSNLGNTCFLNSTLQCLAYLPPLCQSLMAMPDSGGSGGSGKNGKKGGKISQGKRVTLMLRTLFLQVHGSNGSKNHGGAGQAFAPKAIVRAVPTLGACGSRSGYKFRPGRQEDAHEFLVHFLDAMNDGELKESGINQHSSGWRDRLPIPRLDETTFIHRIFGGYLRSQVRCTSCGHCSNTYDPFLDLSLEVSRKSCQSISNAFSEFTRKETLDSENRWKCSGCKKRVCATKQLTVFRPPLTLCVQLKRFTYGGMGFGSFGGFGGSYGGFGGGRGGKKISKPIEFPANLKLPLSDARSCEYSLTGIIIHVGGSASSGHYTAYVKKPGKNGSHQWFHMDDSFVETVSERTVLKQRDAYVLFYCRKEVKLEFPSPPLRLRASMSAEQAKELGRLRAKARADSLADETSEMYGPKPSSTSKKPTNGNVLKKEQPPVSPMRVTKEATKEESSATPSKESEKATKLKSTSSSGTSTGSSNVSSSESSSGSSSSSDSESDDESDDKAVKASSAGKPAIGPRKENVDSSSSSDDSSSEASTSSEDSDAKVSTAQKKAPTTAKNGESSSSGSNNESPAPAKTQASSATATTKAPTPASDSSESSEESVASSSEDESPVGDAAVVTKPSPSADTKMARESFITLMETAKKPPTRVVVGRTEGRSKVEVMMGPRYKSKVWKPNSATLAKGDEYTLLGNQKVDAWADEDDGSNDKVAPEASVQFDRNKIHKQMDKKEKKRKRGMVVDRWNAQLDQGKRKKVKSKDDTPSQDSQSSDPKKNPFQRIQAGIQRMGFGRPKGLFRNQSGSKGGKKGKKKR